MNKFLFSTFQPVLFSAFAVYISKQEVTHCISIHIHTTMHWPLTILLESICNHSSIWLWQTNWWRRYTEAIHHSKILSKSCGCLSWSFIFHLSSPSQMHCASTDPQPVLWTGYWALHAVIIFTSSCTWSSVVSCTYSTLHS